MSRNDEIQLTEVLQDLITFDEEYVSDIITSLDNFTELKNICSFYCESCIEFHLLLALLDLKDQTNIGNLSKLENFDYLAAVVYANKSIFPFLNENLDENHCFRFNFKIILKAMSEDCYNLPRGYFSTVDNSPLKSDPEK